MAHSRLFCVVVLLLLIADSRQLDEVKKRKIRQGFTGALIGSSLGLVTAASTMSVSGGHPKVQDGVTFLWAGLAAGAAVGFQLDHTIDDRAQQAISGLEEGCVVGATIGMVFNAFGSSSSSSSLSTNIDYTVNDTPPPKLLMLLANIAVVHSAVAGCAAGYATGYLSKEVMMLCNFEDANDLQYLTEQPSPSTEQMTEVIAVLSGRIKSRIKNEVRAHIAAKLEEGHSLPDDVTADMLIEDLDRILDNLQVKRGGISFSHGFDHMPDTYVTLRELLPPGLMFEHMTMEFDESFQRLLQQELPKGVTLTENGFEFNSDFDPEEV